MEGWDGSAVGSEMAACLAGLVGVLEGRCSWRAVEGALLEWDWDIGQHGERLEATSVRREDDPATSLVAMIARQLHGDRMTASCVSDAPFAVR